jgi:hypothetical protein
MKMLFAENKGKNAELLEDATWIQCRQTQLPANAQQSGAL